MLFSSALYKGVADESADTTCTSSVQVNYKEVYKYMYCPKWMRKFDISGYVSVVGEVDTNGTMNNIVILESYCDEFNEMVVEAFGAVKHQPARRDCKAVSQRVRGRVWFATKRYNRIPPAALVIHNYNQIKPTIHETRLGRFYYQRGMQLFRMAEDSLAQIDYYQAIAEMGGIDLPYFDEAIYDEIQHFLPKDLEHPDSLEARATLLSSFFLYAKAIACYDTLTNRTPHDPQALLHYKHSRAELYGRMKYYDISIREYKEYLLTKPTDTLALVNLGWYYYLAGKYDSCLYLSKKVMDMRPQLLTSHFNYALVHLRLGKHEEARKLYKEFIIEAIKRKYSMEGAIEDILELVNENIAVEESKDLLLNYFNVNEKSISILFDK